MRGFLTALLLTCLLAVSTVGCPQVKIGGTTKVGGTAKVSVQSSGGTTLNAKVGSFTEPGTTGNQATTGVGFQPSVVLFWWNRETADGTSADAVMGFGVGISSSSRRSVSFKSNDASSPSVYSIANRDTSCIYTTNGGAAVADMVSLDSDGFTLNWTATSAAGFVVNYLALGGSSLTNVSLGTVTAPTSTGNQATSGLGYGPTAVMYFIGRWTTSSNVDSSTSANNSFAWVTSANQVLTSTRSKNAVNPQLAEHRQSTTTMAVQYGDTTVVKEGSLTSLDSDGFTINWTTVNNADLVYYLALKGPAVKVGSFNQATTTGNQAITGVGFQGKALILMSANDTSANNNTVAANAQLSMGAATSSSQRFSQWMGDVDNVATTQADRDLDRTKVIKLFSPGTPTLNAAADFVSFDSDGFTINWTTADGTARQILYFVLGN